MHELNALLLQNFGACTRCYKTTQKNDGNYSLISFFSDVKKILTGSATVEDMVESYLGKWLKFYIERNEAYPEIRKLIHYGSHPDMHQAFNKLAEAEGFKKATVM